MTKVVVVTHGGLGNQLFQMLYAELSAAARSAEVIRIHNRRYAHGFAASFALDTAAAPSVIAAIAALRLPKALARLRLSRSEQLRLPGLVLLDGYFQRAEYYRGFPPAAIAAAITALRRRLAIAATASRPVLCHIRLGDFFGDEAAQLAHLRERLAALPPGSDVVTNRDDLLVSAAATETLTAAGCHHIPTAGLTPEALLTLMARYERIVANDSTLAFWAALLGGGAIALHDPALARLFALLSGNAAV